MNLLDTVRAAMEFVDDVSPYLGELPRNAPYPCMRYAPVGGVTAGHLRGEGELRNMTLQVDAYASTFSKAWSLAETARRQLTAPPLCGTVLVAPARLFEEGLDAERVMFQISVWGSA